MKKKPQYLQHLLTEVRGVSLPRYFWKTLIAESVKREMTVSALVRESVRTFLDIQEKENK